MNADKKYQFYHCWDAGRNQVRFGLYDKAEKFQPTEEMRTTKAEFDTAYKTLGVRPIMYELDVSPLEKIF